jgi:DUF971 family protein
VSLQDPAPSGLRLHAASGVLELEWPDRPADRLPGRMLRQRCPCAQCRQARRAGQQIRADSISILRVEAYGPNAIHLVFSDGHARGIFPFSYLRQLAGELAVPSAHSGIT